MSASFKIEKTVVGPFQCNCYALVCERSGKVALIDPGDEFDKIQTLLKKISEKLAKSGLKLSLTHLIQTHGHLDHVGATREVKEVHPESKICLHEKDEPLYRSLKKQGALFGFTHYKEPLELDCKLQHEELIQVGEMRLQVLHSPGHSPGSVGLRLFEDSAIGTRETLWSGDTLFNGSVGRTDLWEGDQTQMFRSIRERYFSLDGETQVLPGHGPGTSIKYEIDNNPFVGKGRS